MMRIACFETLSLGKLSLSKHPAASPKTTPSKGLSSLAHFMPRRNFCSAAKDFQEASFYDTTIEEYTKKPVIPICITELMKQGVDLNATKLLESARFIQNQLPIRLALRIQEMRQLPFVTGCNPYIRNIHSMYLEAFRKLRTFPSIKTLQDDFQYVELLQSLVTQHSSVISTLAKASVEISPHMSTADLNIFLDSMLTTRISRRVLAEHHIALHHHYHSGNKKNTDFVGIIMLNLCPAKLAQKIIKQAQTICFTTYGKYPPVELYGHKDSSFSHIPRHLEYMLLELLKNAMRASVEAHQRLFDVPPIRLTFAKGDNEFSICIQDEGGGVPAAQLDKIWNYSYTTVPSLDISLEESNLVPVTFRDGSLGGPMAGLGFGMPMTRVYANYFGGSVELCSLDGLGSDVFLRLNHIGDSPEHIVEI
eukprot:Sdes_comp19759_c0_seq1m11795